MRNPGLPGPPSSEALRRARNPGLRDAIPLGSGMVCASELAGEGLVEEGFLQFVQGGEALGFGGVHGLSLVGTTMMPESRWPKLTHSPPVAAW